MTDYYAYKFARLAARWKFETGMLSNMELASQHPACLEIISMGKIVLPLIFEDMITQKNAHWYYALEAITGHEIRPRSVEEQGNITLLDERWIEWGRENGYI